MVLTSILMSAALLNSGAKVSASDALVMLRDGNKRYVEGSADHRNQTSARRDEVAKGQSPFAIVLTCADSRLSPEIIFDQGLGDLFVIRVAGNIAEPGSLASIEYAIEHLGSRLVMVLGHERCGAVKATVDTFDALLKANARKHDEHGHGEAHGEAHGESNLPGLINQIMPSVKQASAQGGDFLNNSIAQNVRNTVSKIASNPALKGFVEKGEVTVVGSVYDLDSGEVSNIFVRHAYTQPGKVVAKKH